MPREDGDHNSGHSLSRAWEVISIPASPRMARTSLSFMALPVTNADDTRIGGQWNSVGYPRFDLLSFEAIGNRVG